MKVCVLGLGYIGLPTASLLATKGMQVLGVDIRDEVVKTINQGNIHIQEPDLDILVKSAVLSGRMTAAFKPEPADVFILAVPTPFKEDHEPDLAYVKAATESIASVIAPGNLIILESTSPVGTTEQIGEWLRPLRPDLVFPVRNDTVRSTPGSERNKVYLAHCPERVLPGRILKELVDNDRVIGGIDADSAEKAVKFYKQFVGGQIFQTNSRTAELVKLSENAYRDVNIAFANELSLICDELKIDVWETIELANRHPRVKILNPGPGVGGHCIAVDPWFIIHSVPERSPLMRAARGVNDFKPLHLVQRIKERASRFKNPTVACLGLSFKADVDDLRESPAMHIVEELAKDANFPMMIVEPHVSELPKSLAQNKNCVLVSLQEALVKSDLVVLLVDHRVFLEVDRSMLAEKVVIDTRGMWRKRQ